MKILKHNQRQLYMSYIVCTDNLRPADLIKSTTKSLHVFKKRYRNEEEKSKYNTFS